MSLINILSIFLALFALIIFYFSLRFAKSNQFYTDTPGLSWLGIFVWGDGLILAPFWFVSAVAFNFISPLNILRHLLIFLVIRSGYEVVYWITHQVSQKEYEPPLFRNISWLGADEGAILYQLLNTCWVILGLVGVLLTLV